MVTIIEMKKSQWVGKCVALIGFPAVLAYMAHTGFSGMQSVIVPIIVLFTLTFIWVGFSTILEIVYIPKSAVLDTDENTITAQYFFKKKLIHLNEIQSVSSDFIIRKYKNERFDGILVYLKNGQQVLFSEVYLADHTDIYNFLKSAGIAEVGEPASYNILQYAWANYQLNNKAR